MSLLPDPAAIYLSTGVRPTREGNRNPALTPAEAFPTKDGWLNIVLMNPEQYARLTDILGDPELKAARFATNDDRIANYPEFRARMEAALAKATTAEWVARMEKAQIAAGPIYEFDEVFDDPQVRHLGMVTEIDQPGLGPTRMLAFPSRASATPATVRRPAPRLGEHTDEVFKELGLGAADVARLVSAGVAARP
jgi:crotonobetainyl-CoA:carnitine CoA-transferase CaiB-like acyl-CoA transferase